MESHQYSDSHYKDKMVSWPSYLYNGNPYTWKAGLYISMTTGWLNIIDGLYNQEL